MKLPVEISPCPIVESALEIRFKSDFPADAIIGALYSGFTNNGEVSNLTTLPIAQIPIEVRNQDINLKYKPTHRLGLSPNNSQALIGSNVVMITIPGKYTGWNNFYNAAVGFINNLREIQLIREIEYVGLRYLNFFPFNIFEQINLKIEFDNLDTTVGTIFRTEFRHSEYANVIQITTGIHLQNAILEINSKGSLVDITTVLVGDNLNGITLNNIGDKINLIHRGEKTLFFSLLKEEYLATLNPKY